MDEKVKYFTDKYGGHIRVPKNFIRYTLKEDFENEGKVYLNIDDPVSEFDDSMFLDDLDMLVYCYLYANVGMRWVARFTIEDIVNINGYSFNTREGKINQRIISSIKRLIELDIVKDEYKFFEEESNINHRAMMQLKLNIDLINHFCSKYKFVLLYPDKIYKIMNYKKESINNLNLFRLYYTLESNIKIRSSKIESETTETYEGSFKDISESLGINERSISQYATILFDLDIIVFIKPSRFYIHASESWIVPKNIFANYDKRKYNQIIKEGLSYYEDEIRAKMQYVETRIRSKYPVEKEKKFYMAMGYDENENDGEMSDEEKNQYFKSIGLDFLIK